MILSISAVIMAYLLGSIPSAYLLVRFWGKVNLLNEGDGHISATAAYRHMGLKAFIIIIIADMGKGALAVFLAQSMTHSTNIVAVSGIAVVIGHCWSVFIRFRGGLGALVMYGALLYLAPLGLLAAAVIAGFVILITHKSSLTTLVLLLGVAVAQMILRQPLVLIILPVIFYGLQRLKMFQTRHVVSPYKNELFNDLRRNKRD
jgi:glycerol-3-phosphate acyltransferase PlsY